MSNGAKARSVAALGPAPNAATLHEAALAYLATTSSTVVGVKRVLERKVATWARRAERAGTEPAEIEAHGARAREAIGPIVERLCEVGLIDDAAFALRRARSLSLAGKSKRAIKAHLVHKGAAERLVAEVVAGDGDDELGAALTFARKKRVGPFAKETTDPRAYPKALASMARAGFDFRTCRRALTMDLHEAEERLLAHRQGEF